MINIAVIGAGHWGPNLVRVFNNGSSSRVTAIVDRDAARLQPVKARFPDIRTETDAGLILADPAVHAVIVATPTSTHYPVVRAALEAGKHVLVEKPLARSANEGAELAALARQKGLVLMVGHVYLFNAAIREAGRIISAGDLGRIFHITMVRTNLGPVRLDVDAAWDLAAHDISIANFFLNRVPQSVSAVGGAWINPGVADAVFATLTYPNNVLVNIHVSWLNPRKTRDVTVVGERKMLTFDDMNLGEPMRLYDKGIRHDVVQQPAWVDTYVGYKGTIREGDITIPRIPMTEPLHAEGDHFLECIAKGCAPLTDAETGLHVVRTLEAITASMRNRGQSVEIAS